jgi:hypothetical protein
VLLEMIVVLTLASLVYNAATADSVKPAAALYQGPFVRVDGRVVAYRRWGTRGTPIILLGGFVVPSSVGVGWGSCLGITTAYSRSTCRRSGTRSPKARTRFAAGSTLSAPLKCVSACIVLCSLATP